MGKFEPAPGQAPPPASAIPRASVLGKVRPGFIVAILGFAVLAFLAGFGVALLFAVAVFWIDCVLTGYRKAIANGYGEGMALLAVLLLGPFAAFGEGLKPAGTLRRFCKSIMKKGATVCPRCAREQ